MVSSLLLNGVLFTPSTTEANFFSSILGNEASADVPDSISSSEPSKNLQNMAILEPNTSAFSVLQNKNKKNDENEIKSDINIDISGNALLPSTNHIVTLGDEMGESYFDQISFYTVKSGDTLSQIAEMFDVSINTILWANDMKKGDKLIEGEVLLILPISGVKHTVIKGETLKSLAKKYNAEVIDIASFNGLVETDILAVGDELIIPGGEIFVDGPMVAPKTTPSNKSYPKTPTKNLAGYFINPAPGSIKTQGIHGKNAVDLAAPIGTPIYAAASGVVVFAKVGWNGAYGNMITIQHPNGTKTLYSHLSKISTKVGAKVSQGEMIGSVGNTGRVRAAKGGNGAHLHFEVYGAKNPGADGSWRK